MDKKNNSNNLAILLWLGLGLFVIAIVVNLILGLCGVVNTVDQGIAGIFGFGVIISALIIIFIIPLLEEFAFRFWGRDKKVAYIIDIILIPVLVYFITTTWYVALAVLAMLLAIFIFLKEKKKFVAMTIVTVAVFSLLHLKGCGFTVQGLLCITQMAGLALLCTYLCVRYSFWWACGAHGINNLLAFSLLLIPIRISTDSCNLKISPLFGSTYDVISEQDSGKVIKGDMTLIAYTMAIEQHSGDNPMEQKTFYRVLREGQAHSSNYTLRITPQDPGAPIDYQSAIKALESNGFLHIDTTYESKILLSLEDENLLLTEQKGANSTLEELIEEIRLQYNAPVLPDEGLNCKIPIKLNFGELHRQHTLDECNAYLMRTYGLALDKLEHSRAQIITFKSPSSDTSR